MVPSVCGSHGEKGILQLDRGGVSVVLVHDATDGAAPTRLHLVHQLLGVLEGHVEELHLLDHVGLLAPSIAVSSTM
jgi:hypothetical protein